MSSPLSGLVDNISERLHSDTCADCKSCFEYISVKDKLLTFKCSECNKIYQKQFNKDLIKKFKSIFKFCNSDINKFILLLRKGVYPYKIYE